MELSKDIYTARTNEIPAKGAVKGAVIVDLDTGVVSGVDGDGTVVTPASGGGEGWTTEEISAPRVLTSEDDKIIFNVSGSRQFTFSEPLATGAQIIARVADGAGSTAFSFSATVQAIQGDIGGTSYNTSGLSLQLDGGTSNIGDYIHLIAVSPTVLQILGSAGDYSETF